MATLDMDAIASKCEAWSKTKAGKQKMHEAVEQGIREGRRLTGCGDEIASLDVMQQLANELIADLKNYAQNTKDGEKFVIAKSVREKNFGTLQATPKELNDGLWQFDIHFGGSLHRDSLDPGDPKAPQYNGVDNIIALLNNGYKAKNPYYGWWDGHEPTGESVYRSGIGSKNAYIQSRQERPGLHFMQLIVEQFLAKYQKRYNMQIVLDSDYGDENVFLGAYAGALFGD